MCNVCAVKRAERCRRFLVFMMSSLPTMFSSGVQMFAEQNGKTSVFCISCRIVVGYGALVENMMLVFIAAQLTLCFTVTWLQESVDLIQDLENRHESSTAGVSCCCFLRVESAVVVHKQDYNSFTLVRYVNVAAHPAECAELFRSAQMIPRGPLSQDQSLSCRSGFERFVPAARTVAVQSPEMCVQAA